jgi:hypothetical protein
MLYVDKLKIGLAGGIGGIMPVPVRQLREVVYAQGAEKTKRTGIEIVRDINTAVEKEVAMAARTLPSGDIAVTYHVLEDKMKWGTTKKVIESIGPDSHVRTKEYPVFILGARTANINPRD